MGGMGGSGVGGDRVRRMRKVEGEEIKEERLLV